MICAGASKAGSGGPDDTPGHCLMLQPITQIAVFRIVRVGADGCQDHREVFRRNEWAKVSLLLVLAHEKHPVH